MKIYHIRFTANDFVSKTSKALDAYTTRYTWRTSVYDLYDNPQYKNYTVKRSQYGTDLLGNGVYTGVNKKTATSSEIGYVYNGRFVDTSGRIDIMDWKVTFDSAISLAVSSNLSVYTTTLSTAQPYYLHSTPGLVGDWTAQQNIILGRNVFNINANRYAFFELTFDVDSSISMNDKSVEMIIAIEIDPPVVNGYFPGTQSMQDKFPEWMDIREWDPQDPFRTSKATPTSVGGQLLNSIAGEWISDLSEKIRYQEFQFHIDTVDMSQKAWVYVAEGVDSIVYSITGDGVELARTSDLEEFYRAVDADNVFFWNRTTDQIFTTKKYNSLLINGSAVPQKPYHVWNSLDDIGVTVDLFRIESATPNGYLEDNDSFKKRILDVYKNKPGVSRDAFGKALRRELNLWKYWGATPNSDFYGATPNILEMEDLENDRTYFSADGMPTQKFKDLVHELAKKYPMTWGFFDFEGAFWDADGILGHQGFSTLPRQLDATPVTEAYLESGVGDGNDMYVFKPKEKTEATEFSAKLKVRGREKRIRTEYLPLTMDIKVYGTATDLNNWNNPIVTGRFTIELTLIDNSATPASPLQKTYYCNITASAKNNKDYYLATPSEDARAFIEWTTPDGWTDIAYEFKDKITGEPYDGGQIPLSLVTSITVKPGHYNGDFATPSYDLVPTQSTYKLWFDGEPNNVLGLGGSSVGIAKTPYLWYTHFGALWFESQSTNYAGATPNSWKSQEYNYTVKLNGAAPNMSKKDYTLMIPSIPFPTHTTSKSIIVEIVSNIGFNLYGAFTDTNSSTPGFISSTYIAVDGDATWTTGYKKTFGSTTQFITFSTVDSASYPVTNAITWIPFEKSITTSITGKVDSNGPWRYGLEPQIGNTDYRLTTLSLNRDSFGIANNTNYIITWMGVESVSNDDVIAWIDSNTVKPAVTDPGEVNLTFTYPASAIVETLNSTTGKYEFSSFNFYARLKPGTNQKWHPKIHSGWFYDDTEEYYMYASPNTEQATAATHYLKTVNRQGAPIIVDKNAHNYTAAMDILRDAVFYIDADYASTTNQQSVTNLGTGGDALNARYGSTTGVDANDPKLLEWSGTNYLYLPGVAGNNATVPDSAALDITGDVELEVIWDSAPDWSQNGTGGLLVGKEAAANRSYSLRHQNTTKRIELVWTVDGSTPLIATANADVPIGTNAVKATLDVDNGAGGCTATFYSSSNYGASYSIIGTAITQAFTTSLFLGTGNIGVGAGAVNGPFQAANWRRAIIRNGIGGTTAADINFTRGITSGGQTSFTESSSNAATVTINRSATGRKSVAVTRPVWLFGVDDYMEINDNSLLDFGANDSFTVLWVGRQWAPVNVAPFISKRDTAAAAGPMWSIVQNNSTYGIAAQAGNGGNSETLFFASPTWSAGAFFSVAIAWTGAQVTPYVNGIAGTPQSFTIAAGDKTNSVPMRIGRHGTAGNIQEFEFMAAAIFRKTLSAAELSVLSDYFSLAQRPPLNATPSQLRQTAFFNDASTPYRLSLSNTQKIMGNGTNQLYVAYKDIYNISVKDNTTGQAVSVSSTTSSSNIVMLTTNTLTTHEYAVTYTPRNSYYVDNEYIDTDGTLRTKIVFDQRPIGNAATSYNVSYEVSPFDPATPVAVPLNPNYTAIDEGFLYIDNDVYDASQVEVSISPTKIIADGYDYAVVSLRSYDIYGNPKPYQKFNLYTNFGVLSDATLTTDADGFAFTVLSSNNWLPSTPSYPATPALLPATPGGATQGLLLVDGTVDAKVGYEIQIPYKNGNRLVAVLDSDIVLADGTNATFILGRVETATHGPVPGAVVYWRKSRNLYDLFRTPYSTSSSAPDSTGLSGRVTADANGRFKIGPFKPATEVGYWLASAESSSYRPGADVLGSALLWIDADYMTDGESTVKNLGTAGTALDGSTYPPFWNPKVLKHTGTNYFYIPKVTTINNHARINSVAQLNITGDIEIVCRVSLDDWSTGSNQRIATRRATAGGSGQYEFWVNGTGYLSYSGTSFITATASVSVYEAGMLDDVTYWIKMTRRNSDGRVQFFWAPDQATEPTNWTQMGIDVFAAGTITNNSEGFYVGTIGDGVDCSGGKYYRVILRNGIDGTIAADIDFTRGITSGAQTSFTEFSSNAATVSLLRNNGVSDKKPVGVTRNVMLFGFNDYIEFTGGKGLLRFGASDSFTIMVIARQWNDLTEDNNLFTKDEGYGGWKLRTLGSTQKYYFSVNDGVTTSFVEQPFTGGVAAGLRQAITGVRNATTDKILVYENDQATPGITDATTGSIGTPFENPKLASAANLEVFAAMVWNKALTTAEIKSVVDYYNDIILSSGELTGDIVYWYEYPNVTSIIDDVTGMPVSTSQDATPYASIPTSTLGSAFPTTYDEAKPEPGYTAGVVAWTPPTWYAIDKYKQYQMGLYGNQYGVVGATPIYPDYKEL